jgi:hypothetical protein
MDCPPGAAVGAATGNVTTEDPAGILTEAGAVKLGSSLEITTVTPPRGAALESDILHMLVEPAVRLVGLQDSMSGVTGLRFKLVVTELLEAAAVKVAVMVTVWGVVILPATTTKAAEWVRVATVTDEGIVNKALFTLNCTVCGSMTWRFNVTVHVLDVPEVKEPGVQATDDTAGMLPTTNKVDCEEPFKLAVRVTLIILVSSPTVAVKVLDMAPTATVTVDGVASKMLLSDSLTMLPPDGAG